VVRWEKSTRPFLRTSEFLWQEGHTCHRTEEEAEEEALKMLEVYRDFIETELAVPVITGQKSEREKFAGALRTYTVEALMSDGRALQSGTSHNLGQHFARVFDITYLDQDDELKYVWQTSWGVSTRLIGALIMVHGDDRGLVIPPRVAPVHAVLVPILSKKAREEVLQKVEELSYELKDLVRIKLDDREGHSPGWKFNEWEMKGVPLRLELGPRDLEKNQVVAVRRDSGEKEEISFSMLKKRLPELLEEIQSGLYQAALAFKEENTVNLESYQEFTKHMEEKRGLVTTHWCGKQSCEESIKDDTRATIRCIYSWEPEEEGSCIYCGEKASCKVYLARAY